MDEPALPVGLLERSITYALGAVSDVSVSCDAARAIPAEPATEVLGAALRLVPDQGRHPHFAARIPAQSSADPGSRLVAFLGREPEFARRRANPR